MQCLHGKQFGSVALLAAGVAVCCAAGVRADGEIYQAPPERALAEYQTSLALSNETHEGRFVLSAVGRRQEGGVDCRWIEGASEMGPFTSVAKLLVPDEHLRGDRDATAYYLRGWLRRGDDTPGEIGPAHGRTFPGVPIVFHLSGPLEEVEQLEPQELEVPGLGTLLCEHEAGTLRIGGLPRELVFQAEVWRHADVPFGTVRLVIEGDVRGGLRYEATLVGVGDDATTALPNAN